MNKRNSTNSFLFHILQDNTLAFFTRLSSLSPFPRQSPIVRVQLRVPVLAHRGAGTFEEMFGFFVAQVVENLTLAGGVAAKLDEIVEDLDQCGQALLVVLGDCFLEQPLRLLCLRKLLPFPAHDAERP